MVKREKEKDKENTTGVTSGAGTTYLSKHLRSPPVFSEVRVT
jgi:hypothetical protein